MGYAGVRSATSGACESSRLTLPHELLAKVSNRIINEVPGINRVTYDISRPSPLPPSDGSRGGAGFRGVQATPSIFHQRLVHTSSSGRAVEVDSYQENPSPEHE